MQTPGQPLKTIKEVITDIPRRERKWNEVKCSKKTTKGRKRVEDQKKKKREKKKKKKKKE